LQPFKIWVAHGAHYKLDSSLSKENIVFSILFFLFFYFF
jgi:hypothetical protein